MKYSQSHYTSAVLPTTGPGCVMCISESSITVLTVLTMGIVCLVSTGVIHGVIDNYRKTKKLIKTDSAAFKTENRLTNPLHLCMNSRQV